MKKILLFATMIFGATLFASCTKEGNKTELIGQWKFATTPIVVDYELTGNSIVIEDPQQGEPMEITPEMIDTMLEQIIPNIRTELSGISINVREGGPDGLMINITVPGEDDALQISAKDNGATVSLTPIEDDPEERFSITLDHSYTDKNWDLSVDVLEIANLLVLTLNDPELGEIATVIESILPQIQKLNVTIKLVR